MDDAVRDALLEYGPAAVPPLVNALGTKPPFRAGQIRPMGGSQSRVANMAEKLLGSMGDPIAPDLINAIYETDNPRLFNRAIMLLEDLDYEPQTQKDKIVYYFAIESEKTAGWGEKKYKKLSQIGSDARPFLFRVSRMKGIGSYASHYAPQALGELDNAGEQELRRLEEIVKTADSEHVRAQAYEAIVKIGGKAAFEILVEGIAQKKASEEEKMQIIWGAVNETEVNSMRILQEALMPLSTDESEMIRIIALGVLCNDRFIDFLEVQQLLLDALDDPSPLVKYNLVNFLGKAGRKAAFAKERLKEMLEDPDTEEDFGGLNLREAVRKAYLRIKSSGDASRRPQTPNDPAMLGLRPAVRNIPLVGSVTKKALTVFNGIVRADGASFSRPQRPPAPESARCR